MSFFERANKAYFNSVVVIDADGKRLGKYRKSHIPDGPGYQEKFYFTPGNVTWQQHIHFICTLGSSSLCHINTFRRHDAGDTGFKVWHTAYCCIGVGICWDQV